MSTKAADRDRTPTVYRAAIDHPNLMHHEWLRTSTKCSKDVAETSAGSALTVVLFRLVLCRVTFGLQERIQDHFEGGGGFSLRLACHASVVLLATSLDVSYRWAPIENFKGV